MPPEQENLLVISFDGIKAGEINIPAQEITVPQSMGDKVKTLVNATYDAAAQLTDALEANSQWEAKYDELEKNAEELKKKYDALEKGNPAEMAAAVKARLGLETTAAFFKLDKANEMSDGELMKAVIMSQNKDLKLDEKNEAYITARFDILAEEAAKGATGLEQLHALHKTQVPTGDNLEQFIQGGGTGEPDGSRGAFMEKSRDAFKTPPGAVVKTILVKPAAA